MKGRVRRLHHRATLRPAILQLVGFIMVALTPIAWSTSAIAVDWQPYEIGIANREAGRMRALAERLSKQNVFYQRHLAGVQKRDMHGPVNEIDRILEQLNRGSTYYSVAGPPNEQARLKLAAIDEAWIPVRKLALASPYDYLRRAQQFVPPESPRGDPLVLAGFDKLAARFISQVEKLMDVYYAECVKTNYQLCDVSRRSGQPTMLAERVMKEIVFIHAGIEPEKRGKRLAESVELFDSNWVGFGKASLYQAAVDPSRGEDGQFIAGLRKSIDRNWTTLRGEANLAMEGRVDEVDLAAMLTVQRSVVDEFERFVAVIGRFAAGGFGR
ncbi:MAG: hypothetical protein QF570_07855 [Myxococcota bacterium]|nr:hypothetical protein [Myxococcota bacterium]